MRRVLMARAGCGAAALVALLLPQGAQAGTFQVEACAGAPGNANHSWAWFDNAPSSLVVQANCSESAGPAVRGGPQTSGLSVSDLLGTAAAVQQNASAGWTFTAPRGTTISAAVLDRDLYKRDDSWLLFVTDESGAQVPGQDCTIVVAQFQCEVSGTLNLTNLNDSALSIGVLCPTGCASGYSAHDVRADLDHALVTLSDPTPPAPPVAGGPLSQAGWHAGTVALDVSSSDAVGISRVQVNGATGTALASASQTCDYTYPVPCPQASAVSLPVDTTALPDGVDALTLLVSDPAHNTSVSTIEMMIANRPPPPPILAGVPARWTAGRSTAITARLPFTGVPINALEWTLCASSACPPHTAVAVPPGASSVTFSTTAPGAGAYTFEAYAVDAAGHRSTTATESIGVDPATGAVPTRTPAPGSGQSVTLPARPNASVLLPDAVGRGGAQFLVGLRRRRGGRLEVTVRTRPHAAGHVVVRLAFDGRRPRRRRLRLDRGAAAELVRIPVGAAALDLRLDGLGAHLSSSVRLGPSRSA